jgi:hypothetical protein
MTIAVYGFVESAEENLMDNYKCFGGVWRFLLQNMPGCLTRQSNQQTVV